MGMELLEHYVFSNTNAAASDAATTGGCLVDVASPAYRRCSAPTSLAACGILMQCKVALDEPSRSPHQQTIWNLARWRCLRLEGGASSPFSTRAWAAPF